MRKFICPSSLAIARKSEESDVGRLKHLLPSTCDVVGVVAPGIVGKTSCPSFPVFDGNVSAIV